jgi:hypothetical protein
MFLAGHAESGAGCADQNNTRGVQLGCFRGNRSRVSNIGVLGRGREGVDRDLPGDVREESVTHHDS